MRAWREAGQWRWRDRPTTATEATSTTSGACAAASQRRWPTRWTRTAAMKVPADLGASCGGGWTASGARTTRPPRGRGGASGGRASARPRRRTCKSSSGTSRLTRSLTPPSGRGSQMQWRSRLIRTRRVRRPRGVLCCGTGATWPGSDVSVLASRPRPGLTYACACSAETSPHSRTQRQSMPSMARPAPALGSPVLALRRARRPWTSPRQSERLL